MSVDRRSIARLAALAALAALGAAAAGAGDELHEVAQAVEAGDLTGAVDRYRELLDGGYPTPSAVLADPRFSALRDDGPSRSRLRELLRAHARESRVTMVAPDEPGEPMRVRGRVLRSPDGEPIAGAQLEIFHTDARGHYEPGESVGRDANSRLFAFVRTDAEGRFELATIRPGPYPGAGPGAAHVHFRIRADGYRGYGADFRPYDHPRDAAERAASLESAWRSSEVRQEEGVLVVEVMIPMLPEG